MKSTPDRDHPMELTQKQKQIVLTRMAELSAMIRRDAPVMAAHGMQQLALALHGEGNEELLNEEPWFTPSPATGATPPTANPDTLLLRALHRIEALETRAARWEVEFSRIYGTLEHMKAEQRDLKNRLSDLSYRVYP